MIRVERIIPAKTDMIAQTLSQTPDFSQPLPFYLRLGFPKPLSSQGSGLALGAQRIIHFSGPPGLWGSGPAGDLVLEVTRREANLVQFKAISDSSEIANWLTWQTAEIHWRAVNDEQTRLTWTCSI